MQALLFTGVQRIEVSEEAEPQAAPDETIIEIEASGICGSDMHGWLGQDPRRVPPLVLGHEACGIARGGKFDGQRVAINPLITCGRCRECTGGRRNLCRDRRLLGIERQGTFAERVAAPETNLLPVPAGLEPIHAAVAEPCAVAWHAVRLVARLSAHPVAESKGARPGRRSHRAALRPGAPRLGRGGSAHCGNLFGTEEDCPRGRLRSTGPAVAACGHERV